MTLNVNYVKLIKLYINIHLKLGDLEFYNGEHAGVCTHVYLDLCVRGGNANEKCIDEYGITPREYEWCILGDGKTIAHFDTVFVYLVRTLGLKTGKCGSVLFFLRELSLCVHVFKRV